MEPLGPMYSNYINTLLEAVRIIQEVGIPNLFTKAVLLHLFWAKESLADIVSYSDYIHHIHMDYPVSYPEYPFPKVEDDFDYIEFLNAIKDSEYQGTLTNEADIPKEWKHVYRDTSGVFRNFCDCQCYIGTGGGS